jgi:hypothetical protein
MALKSVESLILSKDGAISKSSIITKFSEAFNANKALFPQSLF